MYNFNYNSYVQSLVSQSVKVHPPFRLNWYPSFIIRNPLNIVKRVPMGEWLICSNSKIYKIKFKANLDFANIGVMQSQALDMEGVGLDKYT